MSSLKMHIAISEEIRKQFNLSNDFLLGAILPDIIKLLRKERITSHFEIDNQVDLEKFKKMQTNINSDLVLGYYAHLIEDKIWFESYMLNKYCILPDYTDDKLYSDYSYVDESMYKKLNLDTLKIKKDLLSVLKTVNINDICLMEFSNKYILNKDEIRLKIEEVWKDYPTTEENYFFTQTDSEEYYKLAVTTVNNYISKILI